MKQKLNIAYAFLLLSVLAIIAILIIQILGPPWSWLSIGFVISVGIGLASMWYMLARRLVEKLVKKVEDAMRLPEDQPKDLPADMSEKEKAILSLWKSGTDVSEIAKSHHYTEHTVYNIISELRKRYGEDVVPRRRRKRL